MTNRSYASLSLLSICLSLALGACASAPASPQAIAEVNHMPHPGDESISSLKQLFKLPVAPKAALGEFADRCDEDFSEKGATTLVKQDAERMHWCFYAKLLRLQSNLQGDTRLQVRQKKAKETFKFLTPIALAFLEINHDAHYTYWEKHYSNKAAEWVFIDPSQANPARNSSRAPASVIVESLIKSKKPRTH